MTRMQAGEYDVENDGSSIQFASQIAPEITVKFKVKFRRSKNFLAVWGANYILLTMSNFFGHQGKSFTVKPIRLSKWSSVLFGLFGPRYQELGLSYIIPGSFFLSKLFSKYKFYSVTMFVTIERVRKFKQPDLTKLINSK